MLNKRIIKVFREGDTVPEDAQYLKSFFRKVGGSGPFQEHIEVVHYFLIDIIDSFVPDTEKRG